MAGSREAVFPHWSPVVEAVSLDSATTHLAHQSLPLRHDAAVPAAQPLPLFQSRAVAVPSAPSSASRPAPCTRLADTVCTVGGPVWALDWRPRGSDACEDEYLAVGTRDCGWAHPVLGVASAGPGAVQLWRVPARSTGAGGANADDGRAATGRPAKKARAAAAPPAAQPDGAPALALLMAHTHGTVWDLKWRPATGGDAHAGSSLGLLAVACGDGTVAVVSVPDPRRVSSAQAPAAVTMRPAWRGSNGPVQSSRGQPGLPWCLAWHPQPPAARLLAGCTDGVVFVYNLAGCASGQAPAAPMMCLLTGSSLPVRAVCWQPDALPGGGALAAACHDDGIVSVWDAQQQAHPVWRGREAHSLILSLAWWPTPRMLVSTSENGRLTIHNLRLGPVAPKAAAQPAAKADGTVQIKANDTAVASWGLDLMPPSGDKHDSCMAAMCGADGALHVVDPVGVLTTYRGAKKVDPSKRAASATTTCVVASFHAAVNEEPEDGAPASGLAPLTITCGGDGKPQGATMEGYNVARSKEKADVIAAVTTRPEQSLHRCRWSPALPSPGASTAGGTQPEERFLACGGAAGLLRILRLRMRSKQKGGDDIVDDDDVSD